jgi:hypothetical protein
LDPARHTTELLLNLTGAGLAKNSSVHGASILTRKEFAAQIPWEASRARIQGVRCSLITR